MKAALLRLTCLTGVGLLAVLFVFGLTSTPSSAQPPKVSNSTPDLKPGEKSITVDEARERAKLLHNVYASTLEVMHHRYFRADRATLPARALEDVFSDMEEQTKIKARWIAVNTPAMSVNHEPETDFEKKAAREIAAGKSEFEQVEKGVYQRAGVIPLGAGCVGCHTKLFSTPAKTPRFAGLVIRIPVTEK